MSNEPAQPPDGESGAKRTRGPGKRKLSVEEYDRIGDLRAKRVPYRKIAARYDVDEKTIRNIYNTEVLPAVKISPGRSVEASLHRLEVLQATCWRCFESNKPAETVEQIKEVLGEANDHGPVSKKEVERVVKNIVGKGKMAWLNLIHEIEKTICQLEGHYAPKRIRVETSEEFRVAGMTPDEVMATQLAAIRKRIVDVKIREARLRGESVVVDGELLSIETNGDQP